ncbi:Spo0E family sporulation regulatory protein-aspartic acid phosphatase [Thalassobacillus sp. B23F22_16]|uniref:Spo0E family sporulation regulatory protein-aspartic acid phosphatase n=1 Tax=Thalassobacillus sp. B23F22_16 TaxID=3459513 RepID=UPI00373E117C
MSNFNQAEQLLERIERLRNKMTRVALVKGFSSPESVRISQELDELLNIYDDYTNKYKKT